MRYIVFVILSFVTTALFGQSTVKSIPNQKLIDNSYVSNPDGILDQRTVGQIDTILASLEKKTTVQVAVVAVKSIGNEDEFEFAQQLFTEWGIGNKQKDNGLLLLLVEDIRKIRFHTGYGLEGVLPDVICKRIQTQFMVPEFKNGNYNAGMLAGIQQVEKIITDPSYAEELKEENSDDVSDFVGFAIIIGIVGGLAILINYIVLWADGKFTDSKYPKKTLYPEMRVSRLHWLVQFALMPVLIVALCGIAPLKNPSMSCVLFLYLYFLLTLFHRLWRMKKVISRLSKKQDYQQIVEFIRDEQVYWIFMAVLFPLPFAFYLFVHGALRRKYRDHPRYCGDCKNTMQKLDEKTEDQFLSAGMQLEELLKAVNYDVWKCNGCQKIEVMHYPNRESRYSACPKCKTVAYYLSKTRTIEAATYSSGGKEVATYVCKFCKHTVQSEYSTPKLTPPSSSSSDSSSSFSSSDSSSSSGGSWGGGSSGGGGASSSW